MGSESPRDRTRVPFNALALRPEDRSEPGMAQHRVTVPAYKPEAQARVSPTLACASGLYHPCAESQECYPNRSDFEPCPEPDRPANRGRYLSITPSPSALSPPEKSAVNEPG